MMMMPQDVYVRHDKRNDSSTLQIMLHHILIQIFVTAFINGHSNLSAYPLLSDAAVSPVLCLLGQEFGKNFILMLAQLYIFSNCKEK